ncbi:hypothetical protein GNF18_10460 [Ligilactobacillus pobuzihii]|uniref:hypothetical protein n=1 Tax=Ligilactobacillus pobuzihii TaxID=449659 RepID=UPI0019D07E98|nr:hypothetical protein [Ligilactobacillus pobuzihii]MBN7275563.1 hypothetical protein [Ligilactobacillus pobuzihii]
MSITKQSIKNDVKRIEEAVNGIFTYNVSFYFEYSENGTSKIEQFSYAEATSDSETEKSMLERMIRTFSSENVKKKWLGRI